MAIRVVGPDGDHRQARHGAVEKRVEPGVGGAVVGHLEHVNGPGIDWHGLGFRVGCEEHLEAAPAGEEDQSGLVEIGGRRSV